MVKKTFKIIKWIIYAAILGIAVFVIGSIIIARANNQTPRIFGYSFHLVLTDSMTPEILVDDFVLAKKVKNSEIKVGDDIVFHSQDPNYQDATGKGLPIIHRVIKITSEGKFITQGIKAGAPVDVGEISEPIGKFAIKSSFLGKVFKFFSSITNIIFALLVIVLLYVTVKLAIKFIKTAKSKDQNN